MKWMLAAALVLTACAQPSAPPSMEIGAGQRAGDEVPLPRVVFPDGYAVHVELAVDEATRAQGLMYRDRLREQWGMLFFFPQSSVQSFWMKDTLIPLDIIWLDEERRIVHVKHDVPPCRADPCPSYDPGVPAKYVLEVAAGVARQHNLAAGSVLRFEGLDAVAAR